MRAEKLERKWFKNMRCVVKGRFGREKKKRFNTLANINEIYTKQRYC